MSKLILELLEQDLFLALVLLHKKHVWMHLVLLLLHLLNIQPLLVLLVLLLLQKLLHLLLHHVWLHSIKVHILQILHFKLLERLWHVLPILHLILGFYYLVNRFLFLHLLWLKHSNYFILLNLVEQLVFNKILVSWTYWPYIHFLWFSWVFFWNLFIIVQIFILKLIARQDF